MQNNIYVIIVSYKYPEKKLLKLKEDLIREGISKDTIIFHKNDVNNVGYAEGINEEVRQNLNDYTHFLILNPDIVLSKGFLSPLMRTFESNVHIGIVGPKILNNDLKIWAIGGSIDPIRYSGKLLENGENDTNEKEILPVDYVSGTAMLIRSDVFKKIGLFNKDYFLYYEDVDFCVRAKRVGFINVINTASVIIHTESSTTKKNSPLHQYYMARNHLLFLEKFAPFLIKLREFLRLPKTIYSARNKKYELLGIKDYFLRRFKKNENWG